MKVEDDPTVGGSDERGKTQAVPSMTILLGRPMMSWELLLKIPIGTRFAV
jgi:hypothetical protein